MELGMIGLGRMGGNMARRLLRGRHRCVVYDLLVDRGEELQAEGAQPVRSLDELVRSLAPPRAVWVMVPAGAATEEAVADLAARLEPGDTIVDGGNSHFRDDLRRSRPLAARGIRYVDAGTSGGVWGLERGYCLTLGGDREAVERLTPLLRTLAPADGTGYLYCGPAGAGHFVKMVHNGIEYGLMQAYAEGFNLLREAGSFELPADSRYDFDLAAIAEVWRHGSVVSSWLLDLAAAALAEDPELSGYQGFVEDSGEGRWALMTAVEEAVPAEVLSAALFARFRSRREHTFAEKVLSAMRHRFGGHVELRSEV
jgi:6-phosphogluconate dehydrogenase